MKYISLFFILINQAFAKDCTEKDNIDLLSQIPRTHQDSIGYCYAHAAAGLINNYALKNGHIKNITDKKNLISPNSIAFNQEYLNEQKQYVEDITKSFPRLRTKEKELLKEKAQYQQYLKTIPYYQEAKKVIASIPKNTPEYKSFYKSIEDFETPLLEYNFELRSIQRKMEALLLQEGESAEGKISAINSMLNNGVCYESDFPSLDYKNAEVFNQMTTADAVRSLNLFFLAETKSETLTCDAHKAIKTLFPTIKTKDFNKILTQVAKSESKNKMKELYDRACYRKRPKYFNEIQSKDVYQDDDKQKVQTIFNYLKEKTPLSVGFSVKPFIDDDDSLSRLGTGHQSIIAGSQCVEGKLHYIVMSTWDTNRCLDYLKKHKDPKFFCTKDGHLGLDADVLAKYTHRLSIIEKR